MFWRRGRTMPSLGRALFILPIWATSVIWMWGWWLTADYPQFLPLFVPLTLALLYEFAILPSVFLYFVIKAKKPKRRIAPKNKKVAVISLCVPSCESLEIVESQLRAMAGITYPHDSWILDEGNSKEIKQLAAKYGVKHFSRKGQGKYNQPHPPFMKKTKAGNVNAWVNHVKRRKYDYFVQLDIDHIPRPNYLNKTLGHFRDPKVAWVQGPSVYSNLKSWTARGAAEQELVLQGPLQMGFYGHSETPFIIGSHCTYRMSAINEIGGFQPTRAEDHLDTLYLSHKGYKGVFLPEIIAEGDGPESLNTYFDQQFAWAYSMFQVLLMHTPKLLKSMSPKSRWQFLFAQTWYPLWALSYLIMFMTPILALMVNRDVASVDPEQMLLHFVPTFLCSYLVWWAARPLMQPRGLMLSWRGFILHAVRWPIILRAILAAAFKIKKPYMITPKGKFAHTALSVITYKPFLLLGLMSTGTIIAANIINKGNIPISQVVFTAINAIFMLTICVTDIGLRFRESRPSLTILKKYWLKPVFATMTLVLSLSGAIVLSAISLETPSAFAKNTPQVIQTPVPLPVNYQMTTSELIDQIGFVETGPAEIPKLGMYNQSLELPETKQPYIQHSFVDWRDEHYFAFALAKSVQAGNTPLLTIEPRGEPDGVKLLQDIKMGAYDEQLGNLARIMSESKNPVYIRFGHEMELANLYPWGNQDPAIYNESYRYVVDYLRTKGGQHVKFVWSPAGNMGAAEAYYPGDTYVDVIGTTILYDEYWYGASMPGFSKLSYGRQWLQQFSKPVWVVEFGAGRANPANQKELIAEAIKDFESLGYQKLIYLNMIDANIVGPNYALDSVDDFGSFFQTENSL